MNLSYVSLWDQVSIYGQEILARPELANYRCQKGVVIHATTRKLIADGEHFTSVVGVWLEPRSSAVVQDTRSGGGGEDGN